MKILSLLFIFGLNLLAQNYNWTVFDSPVKANLKQIFVIDSLNIWIGGDSSYILYSSDKGMSWQIQNFNPNFEITDIYFIDKFRGWAIENGSNGITVLNNILSTTDGGNNWIRKRFRPDDVTLYTICFTDSLIGFIGGDQNMFHYTIDGGESWLPVQRDTSIFSLFPVRKIRFINKDYGFAVGGYFDFGGVLWHCTNGGQIWMTDSAYADPFFDLEFLDSTSVITIASDIERSYPSAIFKTTNLGSTWSFFEIPFYGVSRGISKRTNREIWGTFQNEFIYSKDFGYNWQTISTPNNIMTYDIEFIDSTFGIAVADSGTILFYRLQPDFVLNEKDFITDDFELFQNYPNPFNSVTTISWEVSESSFQSIKLFNSLGQELDKIVEGYFQSGTHSTFYIINSTLPSGVYYYQLRIKDKLKTKSMIYLK